MSESIPQDSAPTIESLFDSLRTATDAVTHLVHRVTELGMRLPTLTARDLCAAIRANQEVCEALAALWPVPLSSPQETHSSERTDL